MSKITLNDLSNLQNENTAVTKINQNNNTIEQAFDNTLSRDGSTPNQMQADFDMNNYDILNVKEINLKDGNTLTQLPTSSDEGSIIYRGEKEWEVLAPSINGRVLTTHGFFAPPTWDVASGLGDMLESTYDPESVSSDIFGGGIKLETATKFSTTDISLNVDYVSTAGYSTVGDLGGALYKRVSTEPTHQGKFQSLDGAWWELASNPTNVHMFGAKGDGVTDDTTAIQNAINATTNGETLTFLNRDYKITSALSISNSITLEGSTQYVTSIICFACSGLSISAVMNVQIKNIELSAAVRHTTTPNSYVGISVAGSDSTRPTNHIYRDVYIDGFKTGYLSNYLWSSVFDNFRVNHCEDGLHALNLSVNNVVTNSSLLGDGNGTGLYLDGGTVASEGWMISNTLIYNFALGVYGIGCTSVFISNCILDYNHVSGVRIDSSATDFGGNWNIRGNYIAMTGASGDAAIKSNNDIANSANLGNTITDNQILTYAGSTCTRGIHMSGTQAINNVIRGNKILNFTSADIRNSVGPDIVTGNICLSSISTNINVVGNSIVDNNIGIIAFAEFTQYTMMGQNKVTWSYTIPTSGTWTQGDICWKANTVAGGIPGWVCVSGGTPGTWKEMAVIAA